MKKIVAVFLLFVGVLMVVPKQGGAEDSQELNFQEKKALIAEIAVAEGIPPEILIAMADEESDFTQFDETGNPYISDDGGIGIMQITLTDEDLAKYGYTQEEISWNIEDNIHAGALHLKSRWNNQDLPQINNMDPEILENWYFALMAYNGLSRVNDPTENPNAYQEKIYRVLRDNFLLSIEEFPPIELRYEEGSDIIYFPPGVDYEWDMANTYSRQILLETGQTVYTYNDDLDFSYIRDGVDGNRLNKTLPHNTRLEILEGPFAINDSFKHYVYYHVTDGNQTFYISSSNLVQEPAAFLPNVDQSILPDPKEPIARLHIKREGVQFLKKEEFGEYVPVDEREKDEFLRVYYTEGSYFNVGGEYYIKQDLNKVVPYIGRILIESETKMYAPDGSEYKSFGKGHALRVYSFDENNYHVGGGYYIKNTSNVKFYKGYVTLLKDTPLYSPDGNVFEEREQGIAYRVYDIEGDKILVGGGFYFKNNDLVEYNIH
ncbi:transglycosylase SLT domain-containing protein [Pseudalkalibacillus sp. R45]|uniref:transglycosylase SLT domain-containing protein n=1 Tax=Pseudalkalibacillus sp. R45 TaxID=3457433 RepID=UPI003FCD505B